MNYVFPMPNDKLREYTVVASVHYSEAETTGLESDYATVLLLAETTPFFAVAIVSCTPEAHFDYFQVHENIVPAVRDYEQNGGDY